MKILCCDEFAAEIVGSEEKTFACRPNKLEKVVFAGKAYEFVDFALRGEIPVFNFRAANNPNENPARISAEQTA